MGFLLIHNQKSVTAPLNEIYEMLTKRVGLLLPRSTPSSSSCEGIYIKFLFPDVTQHIPLLYTLHTPPQLWYNQSAYILIHPQFLILLFILCIIHDNYSLHLDAF